MTPIDYYREQCRQGHIVEDQQQVVVLQHMQEIHEQCLAERAKRARIFARWRKPRLVTGLYLWGGVGIGKTFLLDCLYKTISLPTKRRYHFHQFMRMVHQQLKQYQGKKDPLNYIAKKLARQIQLLCFDEFFVTDIADAMILARLFKALFSHGVCLVATSNIAPDDLYKNGLQRALFLPAITMLKEKTQTFHLSTSTDYRLRHLKQAGVFYKPNDQVAKNQMEKSFQVLIGEAEVTSTPIEICHRKIPIIKQAGDVIWFDFSVLCSVPRSQHDYLAIVEKYKTVFISSIPIIAADSRNTMQLFIKLIDVFYDAHIRLIFSAADAVDQLYLHGPLRFEYQRTCSRLLEMQSAEYFSVI